MCSMCFVKCIQCIYLLHISYCVFQPGMPESAKLQKAMKALYKSATKIRSTGNVWGSPPKCPYFMMQFIDQPVFSGTEFFMHRCGWSPAQCSCSNHCIWDEYRLLLDRGQLHNLNHKHLFGHASPGTN